MNTFPAFRDFLATQSVQVPVWSFIFNLLLAATLSYILSYVYIRYGKSLSNRKSFAANFVLLSMTTMLIISIVKSSLALSLGLVGALSIVRFRAAIKEPEELAFLFLCIAIGLGFGADQRSITIIAFLIITGFIMLTKYAKKSDDSSNLHLTISSSHAPKDYLDNIIKKLNQNCTSVNMKRVDETKEIMEASFLVEFSDYDQFKKTKAELQALNDSTKITFMDNKGII